MTAFGLHKSTGKGGTEFSVPAGVRVGVRERLKGFLKSAVREIGMSWEELRNTEPVVVVEESSDQRDSSEIDFD